MINRISRIEEYSQIMTSEIIFDDQDDFYIESSRRDYDSDFSDNESLEHTIEMDEHTIVPDKYLKRVESQSLEERTVSLNKNYDL